MTNFYPPKPLNLQERIKKAGGLKPYLESKDIDYSLFDRMIQAKTSIENMRRMLRRPDGTRPAPSTLKDWQAIYFKEKAASPQ